MNAASDRLEDSYPHGTVDGYQAGCRGSVCPAGADHGLSCKKAFQLNHGDYWYQKLVKKGLTPAEISFELGLNPDSAAAPPRPADPTPPETVRTEEPPTDTAPLTLARFTEGMTQSDRAAVSRAIRAWCRDNGFLDIPTRGKIPGGALAAYAAAHPTPAEAPEVPVAEAEPTVTIEHVTSTPELVAQVAQVFEVDAGLLLDVAERSDLLDATRDRIGVARPEWGAVAVSEDVERAREIAARLFLELTDAEAARDRAEAALAVTLEKWDAERNRADLLEFARVAHDLEVAVGVMTYDKQMLQEINRWQTIASERAKAAYRAGADLRDAAAKIQSLEAENARLRGLFEREATATPARRRRLRRAGS